MVEKKQVKPSRTITKHQVKEKAKKQDEPMVGYQLLMDRIHRANAQVRAVKVIEFQQMSLSWVLLLWKHSQKKEKRLKER